VVGRVTLGMDVIERIAQVKVDDDFAPVQKIQIGACGLTGPGGAGAAIAGKLRAERAAAAAHAVATTRLETKQDTSARLARESELLGAGIKRSLQHGLRNEGLKKTKTKTETGGATRGGMYDVLGDVPSDDDSDETSDEDA
jgi:hypothetical protein